MTNLDETEAVETKLNTERTFKPSNLQTLKPLIRVLWSGQGLNESKDNGRRTKNERSKDDGRRAKNKSEMLGKAVLIAYKECAEARETTKAKLQATGQRIMCNDVQDATWT